MSLNSGFIEDGIRDLTGFVNKNVILSKPETFNIEKLWQDLHDMTTDFFSTKIEINSKFEKNYKKNLILGKNNCLVSCVCEDFQNKHFSQDVIFNDKKIGIKTNVAYTIVACFELKSLENVNEEENEKIKEDFKKIRTKTLNTKLIELAQKTETVNTYNINDYRILMLHTSIGTILNKYPIQNNIIKMIKSNPIYKKLYDNYVKDNESNYFFIPFNDFLQIFSKVFMDKIYTSKFHGKYFEDSWSKINNTNGGDRKSRP